MTPARSAPLDVDDELRQRGTPLGDFIRERRSRGGLTQHAVAHVCGVTQPSVARWEWGDHVPTLSTMRRLAVVLDCTLEELVVLA